MSPDAPAEEKATPRRVVMKGAHLRLADDLSEAALEGSRCPACKATFYPPRHVCLACYREGLDLVALSRKGTLHTFTIGRLAPPRALVQAPYVIAQVQLPENVIIATVLTGVKPEDVRIGMPLEVVVEKATVDPEGNDVMAFKFRPASA
jgi:hypothetical protein